MLVLGLDLGTQSCKAVVCDDGLVVRGQHAIAYETSYPFAGHAEQRVADWEHALGAAIAGALAAASAEPDDIAALALVGQLDGCIAVDEQGRALSPALIWQDRRAVTELALVEPRVVFALTGQVSDPGHFAPKLRWLRSHLSELPVRYHQPVSYLVERLTGANVMDPALASTTMLLELSTQGWAPALLEGFGITADELPRVRPATAIAGTLTAEGARLTGLREGTRMAVGTGDDFATPLGAGIVAPGPVVCAIGTAEVVGTIVDVPVLDHAAGEPMVETHVYPTGRFFVENPGWLSGGAVRWATRMLGLASDAELDALAAAAPPGANGVTFVPALSGAMTPVWRPHARGTLHGLAASHDRGDIARAVLEGLAFAARDVVERLAALELAPDRVLLLGGGSRSDVWAQIRADVLGLRHDVAASADTCPVGAAMIALVAAGQHPDLDAAARLAPPAVKTFMPGDRVDGAYARYRKLVDQLAPLADRPWSG